MELGSSDDTLIILRNQDDLKVDCLFSVLCGYFPSEASHFVLLCYGSFVGGSSSGALWCFDWDIMFGVVVWNLWLKRNSIAFGSPLEDSRYVLEHSRHLQGLTCKANKLRKLSRALQGQSSNVPKPRTPPPVNPVKVNTDNV
ncbi:hypothetical protein V6N13_098208 [Hibiscus sabdariffa]